MDPSAAPAADVAGLPAVATPPPLLPRRSAVWNLIWRILYRLIRLLDPLLRSWLANGLPGLEGVVELRFLGRRTGRSRRVLATLLSHEGRWYVGHPNGTTSWQRNIEAAGWVDVEPSGADGPRFAVTRLEPGPERDAVIRVAAVQQFFPANVVYRASQRHIAAAGVYHRLEPHLAEQRPAAPTLNSEGAR
ncbi:MAG: hypothetical protein H0U52_16765 [Chloroflexi bacterium]|nr:hypothetical protein [Chloroflexota bacterium]